VREDSGGHSAQGISLRPYGLSLGIRGSIPRAPSGDWTYLVGGDSETRFWSVRKSYLSFEIRWSNAVTMAGTPLVVDTITVGHGREVKDSFLSYWGL